MALFSSRKPALDFSKPLYTQDLHILERSPRHALFHYGPILKKIPLVCVGFTQERMIMFQQVTQRNAPPVASHLRIQHTPKHHTSMQRAQIGGFLYNATIEDIISLDTYMENGYSFLRKRVLIQIPYEDADARIKHPVKRLEAWMYIGKAQYWGPRIEWDRAFYKGWNGFSNFQPSKLHKFQGPYIHKGWFYQYEKKKFVETPEVGITIRGINGYQKPMGPLADEYEAPWHFTDTQAGDEMKPLPYLWNVKDEEGEEHTISMRLNNK